MQDHLTDLHLTGHHLSDAQFTDLLLGTPPPAVREHLQACAQCSAEAERVSGAIGSFKQHSSLWAERRASARPPVHLPHRAPVFAWLHIPASPPAWTAAALVIALAAGFGVSIRNAHTRTVSQPVAQIQAPAQLTPATLKADNELLSAIDGELRADETTPASLYGLNSASHSARKSAKRVAN
jgi:hypothetical protein